jgi:hypothetical protein
MGEKKDVILGLALSIGLYKEGARLCDDYADISIPA